MLIELKTLLGYQLRCLDGELGSVEGFYFDDRYWTIRYVVANTGKWLTDRRVLISPYSLDTINKEGQYINVNLTKKQIEESPALNRDKEIFQEFEEIYSGYYGWPLYWSGPYMWGTYPYVVRDPELWKKSGQGEHSWTPYLRSTSAVSGYHIEASDGEIGHIEDFIIETETWEIRYLIINTLNWWQGKKVLISPRWSECVNWEMSKVFVNLSCEAIKQSPEYRPEALLNRDYEIELHSHYNQKGYWVDEIGTTEHSRLER